MEKYLLSSDQYRRYCFKQAKKGFTVLSKHRSVAAFEPFVSQGCLSQVHSALKALPPVATLPAAAACSCGEQPSPGGVQGAFKGVVSQILPHCSHFSVPV